MRQLRPLLIHKHILILGRRLLVRGTATLKAMECQTMEEETMQTYLVGNLRRIGRVKQNKLVSAVTLLTCVRKQPVRI